MPLLEMHLQVLGFLRFRLTHPTPGKACGAGTLEKSLQLSLLGAEISAFNVDLVQEVWGRGAKMLVFNQVPGSADDAGPAARRVGGSRTDQGELALTQAPTPLLTSSESPVCSLAHPPPLPPPVSSPDLPSPPACPGLIVTLPRLRMG